MVNGILAVDGSPRAGGNTDKLTAAAVKGASDPAETETIHLRSFTFHPCVGCEACRKALTCTKHNDGMTLLYPKIDRTRGLILSCPTHNYNVTAWMKAFIDRLYPYYIFADKRPGVWSSRLAGQNRKAVLIAVCEEPDQEGMGFTLEAMRLPMVALGYEIVGEFSCRGFNTNSLLKYFGGMNRGRPNAEDLERAREFALELRSRTLAA